MPRDSLIPYAIVGVVVFLLLVSLRRRREAIRHANKDDKLTVQDRTELWDLLQDVMSNPTDELTPAKKKLLEINLGKATGFIKDAILDLAAKTMAEVIKG